MPTFTDIQTGHAAAALAVFKATGVTIDLIHSGVTTSALIAGFEAEKEKAPSTEQRVFLIPRQANFSGVIDPGDVIKSPSGSGSAYTVIALTSDAYEAVYRVVASVSAGDILAGAKIESALFAIYPPGGGSPSSVNLGVPLWAKLRELSEPLAIRAGHLRGPLAQATITQGLELEIATQDLDDNVAQGAKGTITLTIRQSGGGTTTMTLTGMKRMEARRDLSSAPFARVLRFVHEGAMSASPLAIS
jgi:hypothetical protein